MYHDTYSHYTYSHTILLFKIVPYFQTLSSEQFFIFENVCLSYHTVCLSNLQVYSEKSLHLNFLRKKKF